MAQNQPGQVAPGFLHVPMRGPLQTVMSHPLGKFFVAHFGGGDIADRAAMLDGQVFGMAAFAGTRTAGDQVGHAVLSIKSNNKAESGGMLHA